MVDTTSGQPMGTQLPELPGSSVAPESSTTTVPTATLPLTGAPESVQGAIQQAARVLMDTGKSPYQMAQEYSQIKEDNLRKTYGVTVE